MFDDLNSLQNLAHEDVVLTGDWSESLSGQRQWSGEAIAQTTIVGIIFLKCGNRMSWAKSGQQGAEIAPHVFEMQGLSNKLVMELRLHGTLNVYFTYSIGLPGKSLQASALFNSQDYLPQIAHSRTIQTGQLFTFASIDSTPATTLYTMFLAKQDIKMRRKHIWALRKPLLGTLTSPLLEVFAFGRTGEITI